MNVAEYLVKSLEKLDIKEIFGLPGDYNFNILSAIEKNPNIKWIGCTNELNAGYAADGYARENGFGAVVTTYGVGELSVLSAIAGSYAENVPVINIVGVPSNKLIANKTRVHHNFQEVQPFLYSEIFSNVVETTTYINQDNCKSEIDRILKTFVKERKPVYIAIPCDVAELEIKGDEVSYDWSSDMPTLNKVVNLISEKIKKSIKPVILGDTLVKRFNSRKEYIDFVEKSGLPTTNFLMGTNLVPNNTENYLGTYFSKYKNPIAQKYLEETDCLIAVGPIYSDFNSFGLNLPYKINSHIAIYGTHTFVDNIKYENIKMSDVLKGLSNVIEKRCTNIEPFEIGYAKTTTPNGKLSLKYVIARLQEFLKENDILIAETGIIPFGVSEIKFPKNAELVTQSLWASIGWATPATLGTCLASSEKRVILFTGEGAHQISALEIGTMLKHGIKPIILVLNNKGYTIERTLSNNFNDTFNNVIQMNYSKFARVFEGDIWATKVETEDDFDKALKVTQIMNKLCYIEICIDYDDIPELLKTYTNDLKNISKIDSKDVINTTENFDYKTKSFSNEIRNFITKTHESLK